MNKFIFFGAGNRLKRIIDEKSELLERIDVLFAIDNNNELWGTNRWNIPITRPEAINEVQYDYIVITATELSQIYEQLVVMGVPQTKILTFTEFMVFDRHGMISEYGTRYSLEIEKKNIVIIAVKLAYNGGAIAVINAAKALMKAGYNVLLASPGADDDILEESISEGISVVINPGMDAPGKIERDWISRFDYVLINSFIMMPCIYEFYGTKPIIWWMHESSFFYPNVIMAHPKYKGIPIDKEIKVMAVSASAKRCFEKYFPDRVDGLLTIAVPDTCICETSFTKNKLVFAFVGEIFKYKGVDKIVDAFLELPPQIRGNSELWIIGRNYEDEYGKRIRIKCENEKCIQFLGVMTRKKIEEIYKRIDVLVCASPEETLSMACVDAMTNGKTCIVSSGAGISDYLDDGVNALIFNPDDISELTDKMQWVMEQMDKANTIGRNAREVFLQNFTYDTFIQKINQIIQEFNCL